MNKLILSVLCVLALFAAVLPCCADTVNGVLAEERVVNLPNDSGKWYISVVGNANDARYNEIVGWFSTNPSLKTLKDQVHFCPVTTNTNTYKERYAGNVKALPTVRMQKADGTVVYEAAGRNIPISAGGLNGALANSVTTERILPWRRDVDRQLRDREQPDPKPDPTPDPDPQPIDDGAAPVIDDDAGLDFGWLPLLCIGGLLVGIACGYGRQLYQKMNPPVK